MAITRVSAATPINDTAPAAGATLNGTVAVSSAANRILVVAVGSYSSYTATDFGVPTYGGAAMTEVVRSRAADTARHARGGLYIAPDPPAGSAALAITVGDGDGRGLICHAVEYAGVDLTALPGAAGTAGSMEGRGDPAPSMDVTTIVDNSMIVFSHAANKQQAVGSTAQAGAEVVQNTDTGTANYNDVGLILVDKLLATAGATTVGAVLNAADWQAGHYLVLRPAAAAAEPTEPTYYVKTGGVYAQKTAQFIKTGGAYVEGSGIYRKAAGSYIQIV